MSVAIAGCRMQKEGDEMTECADAWYHLVQGGAAGQELRAGLVTDDTTVRCAVADGASLSALPEPWARALVRELCALPVRALAAPDTLHAALRTLSDGWPAALRSYVTGLGRPLDWLEPHALQHGPGATFVAVGVLPVPGGWQWSAAAVGDCCLFHTRGDSLVTSFPLRLPEEFGFHPDLVRGLNCLGAAGVSAIRTTSGHMRPGDTLLLASDALAKWALVQATGGRPAWRRLAEVAAAAGATTDPYSDPYSGAVADPYSDAEGGAGHGADALRVFVGGLRETGAIEDDDVTLVAVRFLDDGWTGDRPGGGADGHGER
ncbi:hypothetical protein [Streptomyces ficellus]|uniref:Protein phosphatase 2C domain-containing protein n=1 Tax=Streptomyces ficellus TaxID=1977088 RepID=A0A6I6FQI8_9ACTN|nr:hypothetical protein [Streptomyces ficellus]QGV81875.1 hypothetical protein EIZ62_29155 [Streptomyces ficellus]